MNNRKIVLAFGVVTVLMTGFVALVNYNEWYHVAILREVEAYHFGSEGPSPYYYETPVPYGAVMFTWGTVFFLSFIYAIWAMFKDKRNATMVGFAISIILLFIMFIHGQTGTD